MPNENQLAQMEIYLLAPDHPPPKYDTRHRLPEIDPEEPLTVALDTRRPQRVEIALADQYVLWITYAPAAVDPHARQFEEIGPVDHLRSRL